MNIMPSGTESASTLLIVAGAHESPAIAGDQEIELLLDRVTASLRGERCVVWLGGRVDSDSALVPDACLEVGDVPDRLSALRENHPAWNQGSLTVLLCAPLRFHAGTWWASGAADNRVQLFDALDLIEELARDVPCCDVIVPDTRLGEASPSATPIDLPDRTTLHDWQAELLARGLSCQCHLGFHDIRENATPTPDHRRRMRLRPLEESLSLFADLARATWSSPVLILDESDEPAPWASRLALFLEALGVPAEIAQRGAPRAATPGTVAVLRDSALDDPALEQRLSQWADAHVAVVLLDRALAAGRDAAERWRINPEQNRGPWRALDQALWLGQKLAAQQPHDSVALESLRTLICDACDDFRRDSPDAWEDALPPSLAWLNSSRSTERESRLLGDDRGELLRQTSELLSVVGGFAPLCVNQSDGAARASAGLSKLIRAWKILQVAPEGVLEEATRSLPKVYLTYGDDRKLGRALSAGLTSLSRFSYEGPSPANGLRVLPEAVDFWLHLSTKPPPQALIHSMDFAEYYGTEVIREELGPKGSECSACDGARALDPALERLMGAARDRLARASKLQRVFISYSVVDAPIVTRIAEALEQRGMRCTRDSRSVHAGRSLDAIKKDVSEHQAMLLVASKTSARSDWVSAEIREAARLESGRATYICPVDLDGSWHGLRAKHGLAERPALKIGRESALADTVDGIVRRLRELGLQPKSAPLQAETPENGRVEPLPAHRVFFSHQFADDDRALLHRILLLCRKSGIDCWEYRMSSDCGLDWGQEIPSQIAKATHAVILVTKDFETSVTCQEEIDLMIRRYAADGPSTTNPSPLTIFPFLVGDREKPHPQLKTLKIYHTPLEADAHEAAQRVARTLLNDIG